MAQTDKRHIFLTGTRGAGKSTLFDALRQELSAQSIITYAVKSEGVYLREGEIVIQVGRYDASVPGNENKMRPVPEGFAAGRCVLDRLAQAECPWAGIDEVGYLETEDYQQAFLHLLEQKRVLAVVRRQDTPFLNSLLSRDDAFVVDLEADDVACVIMASGLGKRFGGNKLMAALGGKPMVQWALDAAKGVFSEIVVVTRHESVAELCTRQGIKAVLHDLPYRSDTVRLGMEALENAAYCLFLPGDQPFVMKESLFAMVLAAKNSDCIWQLGGASPAIFPWWAFEELKRLPQGKGGNVLIKQHPERVCAMPPNTEWEIRDVDTPQDLACFCAGICCN